MAGESSMDPVNLFAIIGHLEFWKDDGTLKGWRTDIWRQAAKLLNNKISQHTIYLYVKENKHGIINKIAEKHEENSRQISQNTQEESAISKNSISKHPSLPFKPLKTHITWPQELWNRIKLYQIENGSTSSEPNPKNHLADIISASIHNELNLPCPFAYQLEKTDTTSILSIHIKGSCEECGSIINIRAQKLNGTQLELQVSTYDTRKIDHKVKQQLKAYKRPAASDNSINEASTRELGQEKKTKVQDEEPVNMCHDKKVNRENNKKSENEEPEVEDKNTGDRHDFTEITTEKFNYKWTIKNFSCLQQKNQEKLNSPIFNVGKNNVQWLLQIYPRGNEQGSNDVSCFLVLVSKGSAESGLDVNLQLGILNSSNILAEKSFKHNYQALEGWGWPRMMERAVLLEKCKMDDSLILQCAIEQTLTTVVTSTNITVSFDSQTNQLSDDCRKLIKQPNRFSDVIIVVNGKELAAHKNLLSARSSVFDGMLMHKKLGDSSIEKLKIEGMSIKTVEAMLEFIYTDEVKNLKEMASDLIGAADKYKLIRLKGMCEESLSESLSTKNAAKVLMLADHHNAIKLFNVVMEFMARHICQGIELEDYNSITDANLLRKIISAVVELKK
uniref:BTB domain-containing protein n=1 Tax=Bracon brevicornis TaxID=1563983 RepID=A0A6V7J3J1_9HYME